MSRTRESAWEDVRRKALEIFRAGGVHILVHERNEIAATVKSTSGNRYTTILWRRDPESWAIDNWECECGWGEIRNPANPALDQRSKHLQGRMCAHAYAVLMQAQKDEMFKRPGKSLQNSVLGLGNRTKGRDEEQPSVQQQNV